MKVENTAHLFCAFSGCSRGRMGVNFCIAHSSQARRGSALTQLPAVAWTASPCRGPECNQPPVNSSELCITHVNQMRRRGYLTTAHWRPVGAHPPRTSFLRDEMGRKKCSVCAGWFPEDFFGNKPRKNSSSDGLASCCRGCMSKRGRAKRYGVTPQRIDELLAEQGYLCPVCERDISGDFVVDHDHSCCLGNRAPTCGRCIRGLLCGSCNTAIGMLGDSASRARSAADYLGRCANS